MPARERSGEIDRMAAEWAARSDRAASGNSPDNEALQRWLSEDTRHLGAYAKACAVLARLEDIGDGRYASRALDAFGKPLPITRRHALAGGIAAALAGAVGLGVYSSRTGKVVQTQRGEMLVAPLSDGSEATLNTATKLAIRYSATQRDVRLVQGEVLFNIVSARDRPFLVHAGDSLITAVGSSFSVRRRSTEVVEVLVRTGSVILQGPIGAALQLTASMEGICGPQTAARAVRLAADEVQRKLTWREGMLSFEGMTLGQAAEEFARYSATRIEVDPKAAGETVTGVYSVHDPSGFARAAALSLNLAVQARNGTIRIYR